MRGDPRAAIVWRSSVLYDCNVRSGLKQPERGLHVSSTKSLLDSDAGRILDFVVARSRNLEIRMKGLFSFLSFLSSLLSFAVSADNEIGRRTFSLEGRRGFLGSSNNKDFIRCLYHVVGTIDGKALSLKSTSHCPRPHIVAKKRWRCLRQNLLVCRRTVRRAGHWLTVVWAIAWYEIHLRPEYRETNIIHGFLGT